MPLASLTHCAGVFIGGFEEINAGWVTAAHCLTYCASLCTDVKNIDYYGKTLLKGGNGG